MRHRERPTKDSVFTAVILAVAALASVVGMILAILNFLDG